MELLKFFHTENASKQLINGGFAEDLLSENDFKAVLVNFCCYKYGANASEAVQKISTTTLLELCQLTQSAKFKPTPMEKHI